MGRISDEDVLRVQRASDIVQIIQGVVGPLKRTGSNYKALCPFHEERTPSFTVSPAKQMYYCFGCHAGGDVIHFVMAHEKLEFPDAVRLLADRAGLVLQETEGDGTGGLRKKLYEVNAWAAGLFEDLLANAPEGAAAREYVKSRGINAAMIRDFRLGYAHPAWDRLLAAGRARGYGPDLLEPAGLAIRRQEGSGHYDRFRNRLMFPIVDPRNQVIGFGARSLDGSEPKYLNSPETPLFSKRRGLYGLNFAKEAAAAARVLCLMEGYTDVIMARQYGIEGCVATLGTALTPDHLAVLRRYADTVLLVYDGDEAGAKASERSTDLLLGEECEIRVARMPSGEDPCDTLVRHGAEPFRACLAGSRELFEFLLETATAGKDLKSAGVHERARAADGVISRIAAVRNAVRREMLIQRTAETFGVSEAAVRARLAELGAAAGPAGPASAGAPARPAAMMAAAAIDAGERVGEQLLRVAFHAPHLVPRIVAEVPIATFPGTQARLVASKVYELAAAGKPVAPAEVLGLLQDPAAVARASALMADEAGAADPEGAEALLRRCLAWIVDRGIQGRILEAKARGDFEALSRLYAEKDRLQLDQSVTRAAP
jgi:DNA primase